MESIRKYLPSNIFLKRVGVVALGIGIIVGAEYGISRWNNRPSLLDGADKIKPVVVNDLITQDRDGDGVPDWEEAIWGTDPEQSDTDQDGVSDGDEVARRKNELSQEQIALGLEAGAGLNETEQFARDFFTTTATLSQAGQINDEGANTLAEEVSAEIQNLNLGTTYTLEDIKKGLDSSSKAILAYDQKIQSILKRYPAEYDRSILVIYQSLQTEDRALLQQLDPYYASYQAIVGELLAVSVPPPLQSTHVRLVNVFATARNNIAVMKNLYDNPLPAFAVMLKFDENMNEREQASLEYRSKLEPYYK